MEVDAWIYQYVAAHLVVAVIPKQGLTGVNLWATAMQADISFGSNRWDTAAFASATDKEKFSRLMVCTSSSASQLPSSVLALCLQQFRLSTTLNPDAIFAGQ